MPFIRQINGQYHLKKSFRQSRCKSMCPVFERSVGLPMNRQGATPEIDDLLLPFLRAADEQESQRQLELLLTTAAEPVLRNVTRHKLQPSFGDAGRRLQEIEDV